MDHHAVLELTPEVHHSRQMLYHNHCRNSITSICQK
jgi:hypothetical protein